MDVYDLQDSCLPQCFGGAWPPRSSRERPSAIEERKLEAGQPKQLPAVLLPSVTVATDPRSRNAQEPKKEAAHKGSSGTPRTFDESIRPRKTHTLNGRAPFTFQARVTPELISGEAKKRKIISDPRADYSPSPAKQCLHVTPTHYLATSSRNDRVFSERSARSSPRPDSPPIWACSRWRRPCADPAMQRAMGERAFVTGRRPGGGVPPRRSARQEEDPRP